MRSNCFSADAGSWGADNGSPVRVEHTFQPLKVGFGGGGVRLDRGSGMALGKWAVRLTSGGI
jgi:hypothetical protein